MLAAGIWDLLTALHKALLQMPKPVCTAELQLPYPTFCPLDSHEGQEEGLKAHRHPANMVLHRISTWELEDADSFQTCSQHTRGNPSLHQPLPTPSE